MQELAKTLILNNDRDGTFKAIVNLKNKDKSTIKFFGKNSLPKNLAIGIKQDKKIVKIPLEIKENAGNFELRDVDLTNKLLCAVVDVSNPFCPEILLSGSQNSSVTNSNIESAFVQGKPADASILYEETSENDIEDLIDKNLEDDAKTTYFDACAHCKYREAFYKEGGSMCYKKTPNSALNKAQDENSTQVLSHDEESQISSQKYEKEEKKSAISDISKNDQKLDDEPKSFYDQVKPQIDALFNKYEPCENLCNMIPYSKWVKIIYDKDNNFYVLGLIFDENGKVLYICYGMPAKDSKTPPDELEEYAGFIPKNIQSPDGEGYFVVCQDGETGRTLKIDLI